MMRRNEPGSEAGQSTVEFALTLVLLMSIILFFLQLTLIFGYGNYVHYATFMSARAYLSSGPSKDDQVSRAKDVLNQMLTKGGAAGGPARWGFIGQGIGGTDPVGAEIGDSQNPPFSATDRNLSWLQGVRYTFRSRLFILPMGRANAASSANMLTLTAESWLGREPSNSECVQDLAGKDYDNGC
jgi:hypothetical protein